MAAGKHILFDHDGDGIKHASGWVKPDDGFLVLDRNGNGRIDDGGQLFGADTILANGRKATSGFEALDASHMIDPDQFLQDDRSCCASITIDVTATKRSSGLSSKKAACFKGTFLLQHGAGDRN